MKSLVFRGPWDLVIEDRPIREPQPGEALIRVHATGICGSDLHGYTGATGRRHPGQVMGHETVGHVAQLGSGTTGVAEGALVTVNPMLSCGDCSFCRSGHESACPSLRVIGVHPEPDAAFAEYLTVPVVSLVPLAPQMPADHGALVEPLAVGYHAVGRGEMTPADRVLVLGGGPIGQATALAARRLGAGDVCVSEPSARRRDLLATLGFVTTTPDAVGVAAAEILSGPPTLVFDAVGASGTLTTALTVAAPLARIVLIGMAEPDLTVPSYAISTRERSIIGTFGYSSADFRASAVWAAEAPEDLDALIERTEPLTAGPEIFRALADHSLDAHKILLSPAG